MAIMDEELADALQIIRAAGYRVVKPKASVAARSVNAVGKPFSALYDPKYKVKTPLTNIGRLARDTGWLSQHLTQ